MRKILFILIIILVASCKTQERVYMNGQHENIVFKYDNLLTYNKSLGCIGGSNQVYYNRKGDTIIVAKQSVAIRPEALKYNDGNLYGQRFKVYKDSLINIDNGVNFYSPSYVKKLQKNIAFYLVINGKKHKITKKNSDKSILYKLKPEQYTLVALDKELAYKTYNIDRKYATLELKLK